MTGWDKEYLINKQDYLELFDKSMQKEQESNVEFLEKNLSERLGRNVVVCANGTDALHFALLSKNICPGDEVLVTNFSWISTASVISMVGATPVFCDIDIDTYHMSFESIKKMYSDKVKAIIYPHLFGNMSDTSMIKEFCQDKNIVFIEDACQSIGSSYNGVVAGSIGDISTLSFNANKVVAGISGGGAIVTDGDTEIFKKLRRHGNNEMLGYNSKMLLFNAEVINYRLNKLDEYIEKRQKIAKQYDEGLKDYVKIQHKNIRDKLKEKLGAKVHYENPISENKMYNNIEHRKDITYTSKIVSDTILSLPIHPYMDMSEVNKIIVTIQIMLDLENDKLVTNMKKVIGDDIFDKSLVNETTEDIYDYIVEKTYQWPEYIEEVEFKDKRKLKIAFNKFYENITTNTK